jgi:hypothetical protein
MPGFDGTGPRGEGPMTGRGEGYCAAELPSPEGSAPRGYAGLQGTPVYARSSRVWPVLRRRFARWTRPVAFGRGRGRRRGRGFGRW